MRIKTSEREGWKPLDREPNTMDGVGIGNEIPVVESLGEFLEEYAEESYVGPGKERTSGPQE